MGKEQSMAVIGLGANLGEREENIRRALEAVTALPYTRVRRVAPFYETEPVGYLDQPQFVNTVAEVETGLSPRTFLGACLGIEAGLGRVRTFRNAPRVVDIDLLVMEGVRMEEEELTLPHPRMAERAFVLLPLEALYPDGLVLGFDFSENMKQIQREGVRLLR